MAIKRLRLELVVMPTFWFLLLFSINGDAGSIKRDNLLECYVWFEINSPKAIAEYEEFYEDWSLVGKLIITGRAESIATIIRHFSKKNLEIISGFKTDDFFRLRRFEDKVAWSEISKLANSLSVLTNGNPVLLENEGTTKNLLSLDVSDINYTDLHTSIANDYWPDIWFWYGPTGTRTPVRILTKNIAKVIMASFPKARLIEPSSSGFVNSKYRRIERENYIETVRLDANPISIVYLDDVKTNYWKTDQLDEALSSISTNTVIIYPGFNDLASASHILEKNDLELCE